MKKQGNPVAVGWTGALIRKPLAIQACDGPMDGPAEQGVEFRVRD